MPPCWGISLGSALSRIGVYFGIPLAEEVIAAFLNRAIKICRTNLVWQIKELQSGIESRNWRLFLRDSTIVIDRKRIRTELIALGLQIGRISGIDSAPKSNVAEEALCQ